MTSRGITVAPFSFAEREGISCWRSSVLVAVEWLVAAVHRTADDTNDASVTRR
jgi:hypothetical protein